MRSPTPPIPGRSHGRPRGGRPLTTLLAPPVLLLLILAGCASAPERIEPDLDIELPDAWTAPPPEPGTAARATPATAVADSGRIEPDWWASFGDPRLDTLISEVLERNHDLQAAAGRLEAAAAQARIAGADLWPQIEAGGDASRAKQNFIGFPIPGSTEKTILSTTTTNLGVSLATRWELDLWGRIRSGQSAAIADVQAVSAQLAGTRLSLAGQSAKAWFALAEASQQAELARQTIETYERTADLVRERFRRGIRSSLDLRLALTDLAASRALYEFRLRERETIRRQIEILLGRFPSGTLEGRSELPPVPPPVPAGLPSDLITRRPDVVTAERRLAAADKRIRESKASLYPRISLTGSGGTRSTELGDLVDGDFSVWNIVGNIVAPLFQGGRLRAGVRLARANATTALALYASTVLQAFSEVEIALLAEAYLLKQEEFLETAALQAREASRLADDRYSSGLSDIVTVLAAQRRALETESQLLSARRQRLAVRVDLLLALGGGFEDPNLHGEDPPVEANPESPETEEDEET